MTEEVPGTAEEAPQSGPESQGRSATRERAREALQAAAALPDERERARALIGLADRLSQRQLRDALDIAAAIGDEGARTHALAALGVRLSTKNSDAGTTRQLAEFAAQWARGRAADRMMMAASLILVALLAAGLAWLCWIWWMGAIWDWGFRAFTWRSVVAPFVIFYLAVIPFFAVTLFPTIVGFWTEFGALRQQVTSARETQREIEVELQKTDPNGLFLIQSYSRAMLSEYYAIAMSQAQRSFRYCLIAMWLGFAILIAGVLDNLVSLNVLLGYQFGIGTGADGASALRGPVDANDLVLLTGVVIEFIAAAFLWVYRFSIQQQTYYYRRQLRLHNALLAHRLTSDMTEMREDSVKMIIERLLEDMEGPAGAGPDSGGISKLLKR